MVKYPWVDSKNKNKPLTLESKKFKTRTVKKKLLGDHIVLLMGKKKKKNPKSHIKSETVLVPD